MKIKIKLALLVVCMSLMTSVANAKTRLVVNCFWPPQHFVCSQILPAWLEQVKTVTEGRVVGNIPAKTVAPPPEQLASVEKGIVDAAIQFNGLIGNRVKGPLVSMQPFKGNDNPVAMSQALWETNRKYFPDEFNTVHLLSQFAIVPGELFSMTDTPVNSVEDFASRKVWALPGPLSAMAKNMGAGVVSTPAVKSSETISRGVVDAHLGLGFDAIRSFQLFPYTKSLTRFSKSIYSTSFSFVINQSVWDKISPADQQAIMAISGPVLGEAIASKWGNVAQTVFNTFAEKGIQVVDADPTFEKVFIESAAPITEKWLKDAKAAGIDSEAALVFFEKRLMELSK